MAQEMRFTARGLAYLNPENKAIDFSRLRNWTPRTSPKPEVYFFTYTKLINYPNAPKKSSENIYFYVLLGRCLLKNTLNVLQKIFFGNYSKYADCFEKLCKKLSILLIEILV